MSQNIARTIERLSFIEPVKPVQLEDSRRRWAKQSRCRSEKNWNWKSFPLNKLSSGVRRWDYGEHKAHRLWYVSFFFLSHRLRFCWFSEIVLSSNGGQFSFSINAAFFFFSRSVSLSFNFSTSNKLYNVPSNRIQLRAANPIFCVCHVIWLREFGSSVCIRICNNK